jgi:DNA polymerase I-like protein with 3'-5' exonuclease and polymerase domains
MNNNNQFISLVNKVYAKTGRSKKSRRVWLANKCELNNENGTFDARVWPANKCELITTDDAADDCIRWLSTIPSVGLDIETYGPKKEDGLLYLKGTVRLLALHGASETKLVDLHEIADHQVADMLAAIERIPKYMHNCMFDLTRLYRRTGILLTEEVYDTALASRTARAGESVGFKLKDHDLEAVLERELGVEVDKDIDHKWGQPLTKARLDYAANDVRYLEELHGALERLLEDRGLTDRYRAIRGTLPTFLEAAVRGVRVNHAQLEKLSEAAKRESEELLEKVRDLAPPHPEEGEWVWGNTNKPDRVDEHGNHVGRNGALRALALAGAEAPNLQDHTLLDRRDHPLVAALYAYRKKAQEYSRYRRWIPDFYEAGRIYPQPKVAGAVTSRLLYSNPNIQGVEKRKTKVYRRVVAAPEGRAIVAGDFAQQELRIAAYFSQDRAMLETFHRGEDIYLKTASAMVGEEITDKEHPARAGAKRATLGFLYGLGIEKYRVNTYKDYQIALTDEEANRDREAFRAAFPDFYQWQRDYGAKGTYECRSVLGWRRMAGRQKDKHTGKLVPKYTDRLNAPIQSTAGDILYLALTKLRDDPYPGVQFLMGVHDELVLEAPAEQAEDVAKWLRGIMVSSFEEVLGPELGGPKSAEVGYGPTWGEQTEVEE